LLTIDVRMPKPLPPSRLDSRLVPFSAICADPLSMPVRLPSRSVGWSDTALASILAPPGFSATSTSPLRMEGTAALTAFCAMAPSRPHAEAI
jgi:hypothetical protein